MAKPVQDSILSASKTDGEFAVSKSLIVTIGLVLVVLVIIVFSVKVATEDAAPVQNKIKPSTETAVTNEAPPTQPLDLILDNQEHSGSKDSAMKKTASTGIKSDLPSPINGGEFPNTQDGKSTQQNGSEQSVRRMENANNDKAARELLIRESKIMAFETPEPANRADYKEQESTGSTSSARPADLTDQYRNALQQVGVGSNSTSALTKGRSEKQFRSENATLNESHEPLRGYSPSSRFVLMQGKVINAVLRTAVNTDLPGELLATVMMDVYDSIDGKHLLIPKGSSLIGVYNSDVRIGQDRVNMAFKRLILPNGTSVDLPGNLAMDSAGNSGIAGSVNNHYGNMFLVSTLTAIGAYSTTRKQSTGGGGTTVNTSSAQTGAEQIFSDMNRALIDRNKALEPTITIPSGVRIIVNVAKDIELPIYKNL